MQPDENFWKKCEGERIASAYELEQLLGCGAFGGVFRALQIANGRRLNKKVAVKLMLSGTIQQEELNFALDLPSHQNLVQHFTGNNVEIRGFPMFYLVMELADCSLADFVKKRGGKISSVEAKEIVRDIAQGLKYLHELDAGNSQDKRYVHRDLKLLNVLQVGGVWKIADFGLSKALDRGTMQASKIAGTPYYMPPELFRNGYVSTKWDVWSLGVMIVEMLTGHFPFEAVYQDELERKIQRENPNLLDVPNEWLDIVKGCLVKDHGRRWTAEQVLSAINQLDTQSPTSQIKSSVVGQTSQQQTQRIAVPSRTNNHWVMALTIGVIAGGICFGLTSKSLSPSTNNPNTETVQPVNSNLFSFNNPFLIALAVGAVMSGISFWQTAGLLMFRGYIRSAWGDKQGELSDYTEAIRLKPLSVDAYMNRGVAKYRLGDRQGAISDYNKVIQIDPNCYFAYRKLGEIKYDLGDKQGAISDYNKVIQIAPAYPFYRRRGEIKYDLGDKQGAISDYNEVIRLMQKVWLGPSQPCFTYIYWTRADIKNDLGDKQGAISDYSEAIRLIPYLPEPYYKRGVIKKEIGDIQEALADFREVVRLYQQSKKAEWTEWHDKSLDRIKELGG